MKLATIAFYGLVATIVLFTIGSSVFWHHIYWPIKENAFSDGVEVGVIMQKCGVNPSPALNKYLSHFVKGDMATHNCELLLQEAGRYNK